MPRLEMPSCRMKESFDCEKAVIVRQHLVSFPYLSNSLIDYYLLPKVE